VANCNMGEDEIKRVFERFGSIERVKLGEFASKKLGNPGRDTLSGLFQGPVGEKHAHIVFDSPSSVRAALGCSEILEDEHVAGEPTDFLSMVVSAHHSRNVSADDLQAAVDANLATFDERTEAEKRARKEGLVDEDGFQLVTYKRKNRHVDPLTVEAPLKKRKELADFYRFQIREKKRCPLPPRPAPAALCQARTHAHACGRGCVRRAGAAAPFSVVKFVGPQQSSAVGCCACHCAVPAARRLGGWARRAARRGWEGLRMVCA
jgi:hypothetical protein